MPGVWYTYCRCRHFAARAVPARRSPAREADRRRRTVDAITVLPSVDLPHHFADRPSARHTASDAVHRPDRARAKAERIPDRKMPSEVHHLEQRRRARLAHAAITG